MTITPIRRPEVAPMTPAEETAFKALCAEADTPTDYNHRLADWQVPFIRGLRAGAEEKEQAA